MRIVILLVTLILLNVTHSYTIKNCKYDAYDSDNADDDFKCYNGGICFKLDDNSTSSIKICNCKPGFTGKQCEQSTLTPCSPDPCYSNGYCNANPDGIGYFCRCKPGFTGPTCNENINDCLNATCHNGGFCIDGINSYQCDCIWPYIGRYCQTKMKCTTEGICKNNGICVEDELRNPKCICQLGYEGQDCSLKIDKCKNKPCLNNGICSNLAYDFKCDCPIGFMGKNCELQDICAQKKPCKNNSTCISLTYGQVDEKNLNNSHEYHCQCRQGYSGVDCEIKLETKLIINSTKTSPILNTTSEIKNKSENNGSFVLVVNISPSEFRKRQNEIIGEFEKRFGIMMSITKESDSQTEMIYPFKSSNQTSQIWTKIYFIFISACIQQSDFGLEQFVNTTKSVCLQNAVNNMNNVNEVLDEIKKASNLFPKYVSNVSYEAYTNTGKKNFDEFNPREKADTTLTTTLCILSIALLVGISLALTVIIRQQKRVKAPVWFPPVSDNSNEKFDSNIKTLSSNFIYEKNVNNKVQACADSNSWGKKFENFSNMFFSGSKKNLRDAPTSPENDYGDLDNSSKPLKIRKTDIYRTNSSCLTIPVPPAPVPGSPDFYPSPPESLPDVLHPVNYKGGSYGLTPLMLFVLGRSKNKYSQNESNYTDLIDSFVTSGADLNSQNNDGETALHLAARCGLYDICERLLKYKAEINVFDNYGRNVLHTAVCANEYKIVKLILDYCNSILCNNNMMNNGQGSLMLDDKYDLIDSKTNDDLGDTSLIIASRLSLNQIIQLLIDYNATVNATDNDGRSALHWCAKVNNVNGALILLKSGANVNMQDNDEKTPLTSGLCEMCTLEVADLLIKYDAFVSADDEIKYNKMKTIMEAMNGGSIRSNHRDIKTVKTNQISIQNQTEKITKSSGTKRKLSETIISNNSTLEMTRSVKIKKPIVKKSTTPSPPPSYTPANLPIYSTINKYQYNNNNSQYQSQEVNKLPYDYSSYYYDSNYAYQQQFYMNPIKTEVNATGGNVNMGYMNDNGYGYNFGSLKSNGSHYQIKTEPQQQTQVNQQNNNQIYNSSHSYAAYF
ncbi:unnamed protein product [Brachionus calyciflorus]|uniref:EGF-like domain-containing protein n=1 Tax=Brachionus calyciflorus TaxID=104777 RepID=A0A813SS32_9BILA|nr:unnamed protein product [Brachionus calyciflorus]